MRARRNKEVNIFSASVVDLFASGLGVFLIVAIIALANQKKEDQVVKVEQVSQATPGASKEEMELLKNEISKLKEKVQKTQEENIKIKAQAYELKEEKKFSEKLSTKQKVDAIVTKNALVIDKYREKQLELEAKNRNLEAKLVQAQEKMEQLERKHKKEIAQVEQEKPSERSFKKFDFVLGKKIQLSNVQFYAGTDNTIEPFATEELEALASQLKNNPNVKIEVSGHIFLTKTEIQKGQVGDDTNLSGRRANAVCDKLFKMGIDPTRLRCVGYGGRRPLYLTDDEYSKEAQLNRRVEIEVTAK